MLTFWKHNPPKYYVVYTIYSKLIFRKSPYYGILLSLKLKKLQLPIVFWVVEGEEDHLVQYTLAIAIMQPVTKHMQGKRTEELRAHYTLENRDLNFGTILVIIVSGKFAVFGQVVKMRLYPFLKTLNLSLNFVTTKPKRIFTMLFKLFDLCVHVLYSFLFVLLHIIHIHDSL